MKLVNICLCLYILLKPYYISKSGTLQISDLFMILAFGIILILNSKRKIKSENIKKIKPLLLFVFLSTIINVIYYIIYSTSDFLISSLQYIYILMGIFVFYNVLDNDKIIININKILKINIIIQLAIYLLGVGRYYHTSRYMGTFNDPNQFAFYILLSFMIIEVINKIKNIKFRLYYVFLLIVMFLIIQSVSTGMILGMSVYIGLKIVMNLKVIIKFLKQYIKKIVICFIVCIIIFSLVAILYNADADLKIMIKNEMNNIRNSLFVKRLIEKFEKLDKDTKGTTFIEDRCLDKILLYPEYIIFGAGQGNYARFEETRFANEIHSTLPSILFYYGVIPFVILLYWIYINLKGLKFSQCIPYIAIFIESFTLLNQRQLLLWFFIILANEYRERKINNNAKNINNNGNL